MLEKTINGGEMSELDTEAIGWAAQKLQAFGVDHSGMDNAMMMDRLYAMLQGLAPTPEVEPVARVKRMINTSIIDSTGCETHWEDLPDGTPLYTHPAPSELVKAADSLLSHLDWMYGYSGDNYVELREKMQALRSALDKVKSC